MPTSPILQRPLQEHYAPYQPDLSSEIYVKGHLDLQQNNLRSLYIIKISSPETQHQILSVNIKVQNLQQLPRQAPHCNLHLIQYQLLPSVSHLAHAQNLLLKSIQTIINPLQLDMNEIESYAKRVVTYAYYQGFPTRIYDIHYHPPQPNQINSIENRSPLLSQAIQPILSTPTNPQNSILSVSPILSRPLTPLFSII